MTRIEPLQGAELFVAAQQVGVTYFRVVTRLIGDVRPDDLLVSQGRTFTVNSAYPDLETDAWLIMQVSQGPGAPPA